MFETCKSRKDSVYRRMDIIYVLHAMLDGINEKHSYVLGASFILDEAINLAEDHCNYRGGKYSIAVFKTEVGKNYDAIDLPEEVYRAKGRNDTPEFHKAWVRGILVYLKRNS